MYTKGWLIRVFFRNTKTVPKSWN